MSRTLLRAKRGYLHSPVDDLESFFWVAVWSVFFNEDSMEVQSDEEKEIRYYLTKSNKVDAIGSYSTLICDAKTSNITRRFQSVLFDWWVKVRDRHVTWSREVLGGKPKDAGGEYYLPYFHRYALQGVVDTLEVLAKHWDGEISWGSWTAPAPPT